MDIHASSQNELAGDFRRVTRGAVGLVEADDMQVQAVKAYFGSVTNYLDRNTSIAVRVTLINEMLKHISFTSYAELGCGDGAIALSLLNVNRALVLVDFSHQMMAKAKENTPLPLRDNVEYMIGDIAALDPRLKFDLIICVGVAAHVQSVEQLLSKLSALVSDEGHLVFQFTDSRSLLGWLMSKLPHQHGYQLTKTSHASLLPSFERGNFRVVKSLTYSDSAFGCSKLSVQLAYRLKLFTARLNIPSLFSEKLLLLRRVRKEPRRQIG